MRAVGIIAEYNPFHTGHAYHIREAKKLSGADYAVVVMSPDFVQRGEPAVFDKYTRTRMALMNGADLVLELPVCYATGSAEYFAQGGVALLESLGVVDTLCFGAETAEPRLFSIVSGILVDEPEEFTHRLRELLRQGVKYPQARSEALLHYLRTGSECKESTHTDVSRDLQSLYDAEIIDGFLTSPNNILGVEYCKALRKYNSHMRSLPIQRKGSTFSSYALNGPYCSATAIRNGIAGKSGEKHVLRYIPENCHELFQSACEDTVTPEDFLPFLVQKLLAGDSFDSILDISPDLSDRIRTLRYTCIGKTYDEIVALLKTKQMTETRIRRALMHLILDIKENDVAAFREGKTIYYAKVLGFSKDAAPLLHRIKESAVLPFITKPAHAVSLLDSVGRKMWEQDVWASHLYRSILASRKHTDFRPEYEISPVILSSHFLQKN